jgi:hypothetical protein
MDTYVKHGNSIFYIFSVHKKRHIFILQVNMKGNSHSCMPYRLTAGYQEYIKQERKLTKKNELRNNLRMSLPLLRVYQVNPSFAGRIRISNC